MSRKRAAISTKIIVIAIVMYASVEWMVLHGQVRKAEALLTQLDARKAIVLQENELLRHEVEHIRDADVLAHLARKKLGLVAPDEIIFIDVSNQTGG